MAASTLPTAPASDATAVESERTAAVHALEGSFSELMTAFRRYVSEAAERVSPGMLPTSFKVLSAVFRAGPITLSALADRLSADKGLVSRSVSELEELGLVARTADPADRRSRRIAVTPLGEERLAEARAPHEGRLFQVLESWSVDDIRHLTGLLHALAVGESPATR
jgi:DNA-binding MarR family transcriptional regulator